MILLQVRQGDQPARGEPDEAAPSRNSPECRKVYAPMAAIPAIIKLHPLWADDLWEALNGEDRTGSTFRRSGIAPSQKI
jgi:hypothetical protein